MEGSATPGVPRTTRDDDLETALPRAIDGDQVAFAEVYRAVQPGLLRYLRALVGQDADDVASETWLHIGRDIRAFSGDTDGFRAWAATIARNRAMDHLRRQRRRPVESLPGGVLPEDLTSLAGPDDTEGSALDALATARAIALIATLPPDQAEAVLLRVVLGLDAKAAARVLGKRAGAVRTAAYRGLRSLAHTLDETH